MPDLPLTGGCQCGDVRYEVRAAPLMVYNCHCTICQRISASAFNISLAIPQPAFVMTGAEPDRYEWQSEVGPMRYGLFCGTCGTRIVHGHVPERQVLSLRGGTLDEAGWLTPVADIWTRSAHAWALAPETRLQYERQPEDYVPIAAAFRSLGQFPA